MIANSVNPMTEYTLVSQVAQKYKQANFDVFIEPEPSEMPFDLGLYRPDLLVKKADGTGYIIEVKTSTSQVSVERFKEIAEIVAEQAGWRFLLVTGDDNLLDEQNNVDQLISFDEIVQRRDKSDQLINAGELDVAFLSLWSVVEALMRTRATQLFIPIERFPPVSLIKHLYSQGELSIEQYDKAISLVEVRNRLVHGFQTPELHTSVIELKILVSELLEMWHTLPKA